MRIFDRYIGRQLLVSTALAVALLSVILVAGQLMRKILDLLVDGVMPPSAVIKFIAYAFPTTLSYTIPWGLLTAVLLTFGRMSADNELQSMRMAGLSLQRICLPVFVVAGGFSLFSLWINTVMGPYSLVEVDRMTRQAILSDPKVLFMPDHTIGEDRLPGHLMYVGERQGDEMKNVQIIELQGGGEKGMHGLPAGMIFAKAGRLTTDGMAETKSIQLAVKESIFFVNDEQRPLTAEQREKMTLAQIKATEEAATAQAGGPPRISDFGTAGSAIVIGMNSLFSRSGAVRAHGLTMRELADSLEDPDLLSRENPGVTVPSVTGIRTEYHRRISFSLACFVLTLIGIPFGIMAQRRETSSGYVLSLIVGIAYFSLIMLGGIWKDNAEKMPHLWVWLPNAVFGLLGVVMFRRLQRK